MADEQTHQEIDARVGELARRVMSTPYKQQDCPKALATATKRSQKKGRGVDKPEAKPLHK
jgi:hypothetical protein